MAQSPENSPIHVSNETSSIIGEIRESLPIRIPETIGHYRIKRVIASGGMGTVYEATQENPRRAVAVKVMKNGISSRSALRRFEYEAQILARFRHSGVAQIFEAGTHEDPTSPGVTVPFFAMEYIPNARTLTQYAQDKKLGTRAILDLFMHVCDAVHHGHQKGIIHRDLKPSNILVDSQGNVKIIDFGVARSTDSDMAVTTLQTDVGQLIGTLQYMSPEQCDADPHDIDTRSDIYSLGVVLYELLSGKPPYDLKKASIVEATRIIRDAAPSKLSTINKTLRGDVETIALKALEKERTRRYQSAAEFGEDIKRYLAGEGITARRASIMYQLRMAARRNRAAFAAVASVFVILVVATIVSSTMYWRAETARVNAEESKSQAQAVTTFLTDTLTSADPGKAQGRDVTVKEILDTAGGKVGAGFTNEPLVEASVRNAIGRTYFVLGEYTNAREHLLAGAKKCSGLSDGVETNIDLLNAMGAVDQRLGDYPAAERRFRESLQLAEMLQGGRKDLAMSGALYHIGSVLGDQLKLEEAESMQRLALEKARGLSPNPHPNLGHALQGMGIIMKLKGDSISAEKYFREALAIRKQLYGENHPLVTEVLRNLAASLMSRGLHKAAQPIYEECRKIDQKVHPNGHPDVATTLSQLAATMVMQGQINESEPYLREAVESHRKHSPNHMWMAESLGNLAVVLTQRSKFAEAQQLFDEARALWKQLQGEQSDHYARCTDQLGVVYQELGAFDEAEKCYREALAIRRNIPDGKLGISSTLNNLADLMCELGRYDEGLVFSREAIESRRQNYGANDFYGGGLQITLGELLLGVGDQVGAEKELREGMRRLSPPFPEDYFEIADARTLFACCIARQGRFSEAEPMMLKGYADLVKSRPPTDRRIAAAVRRIVELYESWNKAEPGKGHSEKAAEWQRKLGDPQPDPTKL